MVAAYANKTDFELEIFKKKNPFIGTWNIN